MNMIVTAVAVEKHFVYLQNNTQTVVLDLDNQWYDQYDSMRFEHEGRFLAMIAGDPSHELGLKLLRQGACYCASKNMNYLVHGRVMYAVQFEIPHVLLIKAMTLQPDTSVGCGDEPVLFSGDTFGVRGKFYSTGLNGLPFAVGGRIVYVVRAGAATDVYVFELDTVVKKMRFKFRLTLCYFLGANLVMWSDTQLVVYDISRLHIVAEGNLLQKPRYPMIPMGYGGGMTFIGTRKIPNNWWDYNIDDGIRLGVICAALAAIMLVIF